MLCKTKKKHRKRKSRKRKKTDEIPSVLFFPKCVFIRIHGGQVCVELYIIRKQRRLF